MAKLRVHNLSMSVDGYVAGPDQSVEDPLGVGGEALHEWVFATPSGRRMIGQDPGDAEAGVDEEVWQRGEADIGAHVMGRNMFGPIRGEWGDEDSAGRASGRGHPAGRCGPGSRGSPAARSRARSGRCRPPATAGGSGTSRSTR